MKKYITLMLMILCIIASTVISGVSILNSAFLSPKSFVLGSIASDPNQSPASKAWASVGVLFLILALLIFEETKQKIKQLKPLKC